MYSKKAKGITDGDCKITDRVDMDSSSIAFFSSSQTLSRKRQRPASDETSQVVGLHVITRAGEDHSVHSAGLYSSRRWVCSDHTLSCTSSARPSAVWIEISTDNDILSTLPIHPIYNPGTSQE